jgi:3',5'-cyclic AMP phosphodiesterase CpdA
MMNRIVVGLFCLFCLSAAGSGPNRDWNSPAQLADKNASSFSFVVIGDRTGAGPDSWGVLDRAIAETNGLKPDFAVHIGDVIDGGSTQSAMRPQWEDAFRHLDSLKVPLFLVPGNHDIPNPAGYRLWTERFGRAYQAFDFSGCRFIFLNTEEKQGPDAAATRNGGFGSIQTAFLRKAIRSGPAVKKIFIFMHQPAWVFDGPMKTEWDSIRPDSAGAPVVVIAGHLHVLAAEKRNGIRYYTVGPTGGNLRLAPNPALGLLQHITRVSIDGDSIRVEFFDSGRRLPESAAFEAAERGLKTFLLLRQSRGDW